MSTNLNVQMVKISVSDIERAVPFYRDVLGLNEDFVMAEYGWAQFSAGNLPVALYVPGKGGGNGTAGQADCLHFSTSDHEGFRAQLHKAGVNAELHKGDDDTAYYELRDPDGNTFKVMLSQAEG
ncbi:MAG: VOC family protein [Aggregatilineales bacterium]